MRGYPLDRSGVRNVPSHRGDIYCTAAIAARLAASHWCGVGDTGSKSIMSTMGAATNVVGPHILQLDKGW
jgi:hypothetical protein